VFKYSKQVAKMVCFAPMQEDTIAAVATAPGEGAIAVIRISGKGAFEIAGKVFSRPLQNFKTHTAHYGQILAENGTPIDSVLLLVMKGPKSYTGEDSVEISCHGGQLVTRRVLERIFEAGTRPAKPGEFSLRAFLNGKIDLAQAEAVQALIAAKSEMALENAEKQLKGALSEKVRGFQKDLTEWAAILEAWVDFPEEGLEFSSMEEILLNLKEICHRMEQLKSTFHDGKMLHEGLKLCLLGAPNVGKSSLMNALLGKERAIVTPIAGTTRDLIEEDLRLGALHFKLIDTAGVRKTHEIVEQEGIRRTQEAKGEADLILLVLDASRPITEEDLALLQGSPKNKTIVVWNKVDIAKPKEHIEGIAVSAKNKMGLEDLKAAIHKIIWQKGAPSKEEVLITNLRHFQAISNAISYCQAVIEGLKSGISAEFVAADMRASLNELGSIIGTNVTEDILSAIFSKFCLGK
jgi:tRNA modification GTPase